MALEIAAEAARHPIGARRRSSPIPAWRWLAALATMLAAAALAPPAHAQSGGYAGEKTCVRCHDHENSSFTHTLHAKTFRQNPKNEHEKRVCEACHGPGADHVRNTKDRNAIIGFTREWGTPVATQNGQCLACHGGGQRLHWPDSVHSRNEVACADCHNLMARFSQSGSMRKASVNETCVTCHSQQRSEFRKRSHMPVLEGKMSCSDCHNPHGTATRPLLKAESLNDLCYSCHAEKRGPYLWEHAPVRDSCLNCHQAHGSNHDKLLVAARPYLCQQCHDPSVGHPPQLFRADQTAANQAAGGVPSSRIIGRSCQNCHTQIHGSNHPAGVRYQR